MPVFPPTLKKVTEIIDYVQRSPDEVLGVVSPGEGVATIEKVAINCAMAGCKPEYVPIVLTALEAMLDPTFHILSAQCSTFGGPPLAIISGPVVRKLGFNHSEGALGGSGHRRQRHNRSGDPLDSLEHRTRQAGRAFENRFRRTGALAFVDC